MRVAVIGAGSSGLTAARNFLEQGFQVEVFESEADLGGNWNYGQPSARVYQSTHTISSKPGTEYPDFPMPREYPDYPHHSQILAYLRGYAERFDLLRHIRFSTAVERIEPAADQEPLSPWLVSTARDTTERYGIVVIANGHHAVPRYPSYPGSYSGLAMHSAAYRTPEVFAGRRVLVIGAGNSGCDLAVEAADVANRTWHSARRNYWYMPKYLLGRPADQVADLMLALRVPLWLRRASGTLLHRLSVGSVRRSGLPRPDHRLFETHPIVNSELPARVRRGAITPVPDVTRFEGRTAFFADGRSAEVDLVVYATGYRAEFGFLDQRQLNWNAERDCPELYLHVFHPSYDTLFVAGLIQPDSGQFGLVHWQMRAAARYARAASSGHAAAEPLRSRKRNPADDLGGGVRYQDSPRHHFEVEHWSYQRKLKRWARALAP